MRLAIALLTLSVVNMNATAASLHDFTMNGIDAKPVALSSFKGKTVLVVNVASKCGFTPQYEALEALYRKYKDRGFVVLGFPSNDFLWQEPGSDGEIAAFCKRTYGVTFPMFAKVRVRGSDQAPLYGYLTGKKDNAHGGMIMWNFTKFLIDGDGRVIDRFGPSTKPDSPEVVAAIEKALPR
ncbi:MAG: glutathione peroxidase [Bryobacteraceae bacterium]